jgi:diketogulonate reductase-like aldo/keto reductase
MESIPPVGLGTFRLKNDAVKQAIKDGIRVGYRHIDTASIYHNEKEIGETLQEIYKAPSSTLTRSDLWITSKLSPYDMKTPRASLLKSISALQTDYLDLYLIHWPAVVRKGPNSLEHKRLRLEAWKVLNEAKREGLVRYIGVSNFTPQHIRELKDETEYGIRGTFVQMEIHPWYWQDAMEIQTSFEDEELTMVGYALLAEGKLMEETPLRILDDIAERLSCSRVQVVMAWALVKKWGVLVRSTDVTHLTQNLGAPSLVGTLTPEECVEIDKMSSLEGEEKRCWDPRLVK